MSFPLIECFKKSYINMAKSNPKIQQYKKYKIGDYYYFPSNEKIMLIGSYDNKNWEKYFKENKIEHYWLPTLHDLMFFLGGLFEWKPNLADFVFWYEGSGYVDFKEALMVYIMWNNWRMYWNKKNWVKLEPDQSYRKMCLKYQIGGKNEY
jgi:hypothetical protein